MSPQCVSYKSQSTGAKIQKSGNCTLVMVERSSEMIEVLWMYSSTNEKHDVHFPMVKIYQELFC